MKPIAIVIVVAAFAVATLASTAKTVTSSEANANDRMVAGVAGPIAAANTSQHRMKADKKAKAKRTATTAPPPPLLKD